MLRRSLLCLLACALPAWACSVPVFRYALEHWQPDKFEMVVTHRGTLSEAEQAQMRGVEEANANLTVRTIVSEAALQPHVSVRFPRTKSELWSGPLAEAAQVLDSPARREIAKRLGEGQSAVWVFIEIGPAARDDKMASILETRLDYLASALELPKLEPQDIAKGLVSVAQEDLRLEFSILRLSRSDEREQLFIKMLLATEKGLDQLVEPIAIPVFGRGRALYALVGDGIKRETIDRAATFLIGKCSCEVKEQNPGADLLITANWDAAVKAKSAPPPDLPTLAEIAQTAPVAVTISGDLREPLTEHQQGFGKAEAIVMGAAALLLLAGAGLVWRRK